MSGGGDGGGPNGRESEGEVANEKDEVIEEKGGVVNKEQIAEKQEAGVREKEGEIEEEENQPKNQPVTTTMTTSHAWGETNGSLSSDQPPGTSASPHNVPPQNQEQVVYADNMANLAWSLCNSKFSNKKVSPEDFVLLKVIGKGSYGQ